MQCSHHGIHHVKSKYQSLEKNQTVQFPSQWGIIMQYKSSQTLNNKAMYKCALLNQRGGRGQIYHQKVLCSVQKWCPNNVHHTYSSISCQNRTVNTSQPRPVTKNHTLHQWIQVTRFWEESVEGESMNHPIWHREGVGGLVVESI